MIDEIEACSAERSITIEKISLDNLTADDINAILADLLSADQSETRALTQRVWRKTGGNAFAVFHFLMALAKHEFLAYNIGLAKWIWDEEAI
jgi:predicted ATPase